MQSSGRPPLPNIALSERVFRSTKPGIPGDDETRTKRPHQYKLWDQDHLELACVDVKNGLSIRRAELEYGIPRSTIHDYVSGRLTIGVSGHRRYLTDEEEDELVKFVCGCSEVGYARTQKANDDGEVIDTVSSASKTRPGLRKKANDDGEVIHTVSSASKTRPGLRKKANDGEVIDTVSSASKSRPGLRDNGGGEVIDTVSSASKSRPGLRDNGGGEVIDTVSSASKTSRSGLRKTTGGGEVVDTGDCISGVCDHPKATTWVSCSKCDVYYHCICVGVSYKVAQKNDYKFSCNNCQ